MTDQAVREILKLSVREKLDLIGRIWDSIDEPEDIELTDEEVAELERRADEHEREPSTAIPLEQVLAEMKPRRRR